MSTVLVVDDEAICREAIAAVLRDRGYQTLCAANAMEALLLLGKNRPDLALLDVIMPGMDGLALLENLRGTTEWKALPVILLTGAADKAFILRARQLGANGYVLKDRFVMDDFLSRVNRIMMPPPECAQGEPDAAQPGDTRVLSPGEAAEPGQPLEEPIALTREQSLARIHQYAEARTLAGVVAEVIRIARSQRTSATDLANSLSHDPLLAARVLEVANSVAFAGGKSHTSSLEDAVTKIGFGTVQKIAARVGIFDVFPPEGADGFNMVRGWQHSFAVAALMDVLTGNQDDRGEGEAHLVGLCHDIGKLVLRQLFAAEYAYVDRRAAASGRSSREVEVEVFSVPYVELVREVLQTIGLPAEIVDPILQALEFEVGRRGGELSPLSRMLLLANSVAHGMLLATSVECRVRPFTRVECRDVPAAMNPNIIDAHKLRAEVLTMTHLLARLSSSAVAQLSRPLVETPPARVWYTRHKSFVPFDPVETALAFLCNCQPHDRLPATPSDFEAVQGLVVAAPSSGTAALSVADIEAMRRSSGRPHWPVLVLAGDGHAPQDAPPANITLAAYPLSLARLGQWIASLTASK